MNKNKSKEKDMIESLEIKLRHIDNQYFVIKQQYEKTTEEYLKILDEVSEKNKLLEQEIYKSKNYEKQLEKSHEELNRKVYERTLELKKTNNKLREEIIQRKKIEENYKKGRNEYISITNLTGDIIFHMDIDGKFIFLNEGACEFWGKQRIKLLGNNFFNYIHPDDKEKTMTIIKEVIESKKKLKGCVNRQKTPKGWRTVEWNAFPLYYESGEHLGMQVTGRDITKHIEYEKLLEEKEKFNFALFEYNPVETIIVDNKGKITMLNLAKKESGDRIPKIGEVLYKDYAGKHKIDMFRELMRCIKKGEVKKFNEMRYINKFLNITISPITNGAITISEDITERKNAENFIKKSRDELEIMVQERTKEIKKINEDLKKEIEERKNAESIIKIQNKQIKFLADTAIEYIQLSAEDNFFELVGKKLKEITGDTIISLSSYNDKTKTMKPEFITGVEENNKIINKILKRDLLNIVYHVDENRLLPLKTGKLTKIEGGLHELTFGEIPKVLCKKLESVFKIGDIYGIGICNKGKIYGTMIIITYKGSKLLDQNYIETFCNQSSIGIQRWIAEKSIRTSEEKYHSFIENLNDVIYSIDNDGIITFIGPQIKNYGYKIEEVINNPFINFFVPDDRDRLSKYFKDTIIHEKKFDIQLRFMNKNGEINWVENSAQIQYDETGKVVGITGLLYDITLSLKVQKALIKSESLLKEQKLILEQKNIALSEIIKQIEVEKNIIKDDIITNIDKLVLPIIEKARLSENSGEYLDYIRDLLEKITTRFGRNISQLKFNLTPREIEISTMVETGLTNKEISSLLNISCRTVENHRKKIRDKLNIKSKKINLTSFLQQLH